MVALRAMRVFARVIDEGSFVGAAQALDVAPAVVMRSVAEHAAPRCADSAAVGNSARHHVLPGQAG